jgi:hypothetical protein
MSLILGLDPAYRTLGISLVNTSTNEVLISKTVNCGAQPYAFAKVLARELPDFLDFGSIECLALERPPFGVARGGVRPKSAALIWCVMGSIFHWAHENNIPVRRPVEAKALKTFAAKVVGKRYKPGGTRTERKALVKEAVEKLTGSPRPTDHEDDATLAAFMTDAR